LRAIMVSHCGIQELSSEKIIHGIPS